MALQIIDWIPFPPGSARIDSDTQTRIDNFAEWMLRVTPEMTLVEVLGHAAASEPHDRKLARARADAVRDALVKHGVPAAKLTTRGEAESEGWKPIRFSSDDPRKQEYRVEFRLLKNALGALGPDGFHVKPPCVTSQPISEDIEFVPGQNQLTPAGAAAINAVAAYLTEHPDVGPASVSTFDTGALAFLRVPDPLSLSRVTLVRDELVARGVSRSRLLRRLPPVWLPDGPRRVRVYATLPNPFHDPIAPGCLTAE